MSGALQRWLPRYIEGRWNVTTWLAAQMGHNVHHDVDHAGGLMGGALQRWLPGYIEGRTNVTTWLAAQMGHNVHHDRTSVNVTLECHKRSFKIAAVWIDTCPNYAVYGN